jgi:RNA polymerase primary sigma factor
MNKKALKKTLSPPPRRTVKRGAPPIIKPRRAFAKAPLARRPQAEVRPPAEVELEVAPDALTDEAVLAEASAEAVEVADEVAIAEAGELNEGAPEEVVELEEASLAAADDEPAGEPVEKPAAATSEPANFLAMYFKEMAELDVLRPEEEFRQAKDIETLEVDLWDRVFAYVPMVDHVLKVIERTMENSLTEFRPLRRLLAEYRKNTTRNAAEKIERAAHKLSERLRAMDIDKRLLDVVLLELRMVARGEPGRIVMDRLSFQPKSPVFRKYYGSVQAANGRAQQAKNEFVKANLRLVVSIARRFNHGRMPLADLIQEGNIGLIKAVERFDYRRGYRFSTYASWWIRHAISRALADKGRAVRLPVHMIDAYHRVAKSKRELSGKLGRQPTTEEIGVATGIAAAKIEKMRSYLLDQSFSLDRPVSDEDGRRFIDFIQDPNAEDSSPVETLADQAMTTEVRELLAALKPIEADILRQRFGLDDDKELTLKEIGEKYNLSRERIRQLQEQALMKMRRALQRKDLM